MLITAAMLQLIQSAGEGVLVLVDALDEADFQRSRLTRAEVQRQLGLMADTLAGLPEAARQALPEIDWAGWRGLTHALATPGRVADEASWFAAHALVPATLSWLRVYRRDAPELFAFKPEAI